MNNFCCCWFFIKQKKKVREECSNECSPVLDLISLCRELVHTYCAWRAQILVLSIVYAIHLQKLKIAYSEFQLTFNGALLNFITVRCLICRKKKWLKIWCVEELEHLCIHLIEYSRCLVNEHVYVWSYLF